MYDSDNGYRYSVRKNPSPRTFWSIMIARKVPKISEPNMNVAPKMNMLPYDTSQRSSANSRRYWNSPTKS